MVVGTLAAVTIVATGGAALLPSAGIGIAAGGGAAATGSGAMVAGAVAGSTAGGAIAGAGATGACIGAAAGGTAAAGVGGSTMAGTGLVSAGISAGPLGWLAIGTSADTGGQHISYDCWKPVLHDESEEPSEGILLKDLCTRQSISKVMFTVGSDADLPLIVLENIWEERFEIEYVYIPELKQMFGHAKQI